MLRTAESNIVCGVEAPSLMFSGVLNGRKTFVTVREKQRPKKRVETA